MNLSSAKTSPRKFKEINFDLSQILGSNLIGRNKFFVSEAFNVIVLKNINLVTKSYVLIG